MISLNFLGKDRFQPANRTGNYQGRIRELNSLLVRPNRIHAALMARLLIIRNLIIINRIAKATVQGSRAQMFC
jgi:hypothetical protein